MKQRKSKDDNPITTPQYVKLQQGEYDRSLPARHADGVKSDYVMFDYDAHGNLLGIEISPIKLM